MFPSPAARLHKIARKMLVQRLVIRYLRRETNEGVKSFVPRDQATREAPIKDLQLEAKVDLLISANAEVKQQYEKMIGARGIEGANNPRACPSPGGKRGSSSMAPSPKGSSGSVLNSRSVAKSAALQRLAHANVELMDRQAAIAAEITRLQEMEASEGMVSNELSA